jgi:signal peptidase I
MSRTASQPKTAKNPKAEAEPTPEKPKETVRDFVEQIIVAIILAILIRGFDAEAFVIPTGSMAPTLMGRHKEVVCPECGLTYAVNSSEEIDLFVLKKQQEASLRFEEAQQAFTQADQAFREAERVQQVAIRSQDRTKIKAAEDDLKTATRYVQRVQDELDKAKFTLQQCHETGVCVNCRFRIVDQTDWLPSYKGDRILVMKFPYELPFLPFSGGPHRWDVVVFHFPEHPETNYIKRLVGMPNEQLRISHGDLLARPVGSARPFIMQRKPLIHQQAMQVLVYDDHYRPKAIKGKPEWSRWNGQGSYKETSEGKFSVNADSTTNWSDLRYRHLLPDPGQWEALLKNSALPRAPRATLITDFYSYNTNIATSEHNWYQRSEPWLQTNWVGDLTVSGQIDLESVQPGGMARLELIEAGVSNRCEVDLTTGVASLYHGEKKLGENVTPLRGTGAHDVMFANVDDRLTLLVDGSPIFQDGLPYEDPTPMPHVPTARDLDPVGIAFKGAKATVSDLVLKRDIYYTQEPAATDYPIPGINDSFAPKEEKTDLEISYQDKSDFDPVNTMNYQGQVGKMFDFLSDPAKFAALKDPRSHDYVIRPDHYMMMGDNSPRSSDSRAWTSRDEAWRIKTYNLRLLASLPDEKALPESGQNLVIIAEVNKVLRFRIFNNDGKIVVDTDEKALLGQPAGDQESPKKKAELLRNLKDSLEKVWQDADIPTRQRQNIVEEVASLVDYTDRSTWEVPRSLLIGKAFFVFWPHAKKFGPDVRINRDLSVFFRPYFERMKWIR